MARARLRIALTLAVTGIVVGADTAFVFHQLPAKLFPGTLSAFTLSFVLFQELLLFGSLIYLSFATDRSATAVPIKIAYVMPILLYIASTLVATLVYRVLSLFHLASVNLYYSAITVRTAIVILLLLLIHIVGLIHRAAHREGEIKRARVEDLVTACDRIRSICGIHGWQIERSCGELGKQLRFCEGLRQNQALVDEISTKLGRLESLAQIGEQNGGADQAVQLVRELSNLATRRA